MLIYTITYSSHDWPCLHGIPRWLPAYIYGPAKATALPREGASALVICTTVPTTCICVSLNMMWGVDAPVL